MVVLLEGTIAFLISSKGAIWKKSLGNRGVNCQIPVFKFCGYLGLFKLETADCEFTMVAMTTQLDC